MGIVAPEVEASPAIDWLLASAEPAIRFLTRRDVLGEPVEADPDEILTGPLVRGLLSGQQPDGGFGGHPYNKWTGAHWRLVSLVELCVPSGEQRATAAAETVLAWLTGKGHVRGVERTSELFLEHRLYRRLGTGEPIHEAWLVPHFPPYWHYDVLQALVLLGRLGKLDDPRTGDAVELLIGLRRPDGRWRPGGYWWRPPGSATHAEAVDWGRRAPSEPITLNALRVLRAAGRLAPTGN